MKSGLNEGGRQAKKSSNSCIFEGENLYKLINGLGVELRKQSKIIQNFDVINWQNDTVLY